MYYQSENMQRRRREQVVHQQEYRSLEDAVLDAVPRGQVDRVRADYNRRGGFTLRNCCRFILGTSATLERLYFVESVPIGPVYDTGVREGYFGFDETVLPPEKLIEVRQVEANYEMREGRRTHPLQIAPYVLPMLDELARRGHFEHIAVYSGIDGGPGINRNGNIERLCEGMVDHMMDCPRPFVALTFYGNFQYHGPRIWFNQAALPILEQFARADERLFMTRRQARSRMGIVGRCNGDYIVCEDGIRRMINSQSGNTAVHRTEEGRVMVQFPRGGYRIKQMLDLLSEATRLAGIDHNQLFVTTVGGQMMNVGVNVRDSSHGMRLTAMTPVLSERNSSDINYEFLRQMLGRLAGIYQANDPRPILFITRELDAMHRESYRLARELERCVREGRGRQGMAPIDLIREGDTGFADIDQSRRVIPNTASPPSRYMPAIVENSTSRGHAIIPRRRAYRERTPQNVLSGTAGYHALFREIYYRDNHEVEEDMFFQLASHTGPFFLTPSNSRISARQDQNGGLMWSLGPNNHARPLMILEWGSQDRDFPIVREQRGDVTYYSLAPFMVEAAEELAHRHMLPPRNEELASIVRVDPGQGMHSNRLNRRGTNLPRQRGRGQSRRRRQREDDSSRRTRPRLTVRCMITDDDHPEDTCIHCGAGHFMHGDQLDVYVRTTCEPHAGRVDYDALLNQQERGLLQENGALVCPSPGCQHVYSMEDIRAHVRPATVEALVEMRRRIRLDRAVQGEDLGGMLRRNFPNARQCGRCGFGPVPPGIWCNNLATHHHRRANQRNDNACQACGWFSESLRDWPEWDGVMR